MNDRLILCLGNPVLSDDRFGYEVACLLTEQATLLGVDVEFASVAGFALLDLLTGRRQVLVVDTIVTGTVPPGTLHFFESGRLTPSRTLTCSHQISLPTALLLGQQLELTMPEEIDVLAVEAEDIATLGEVLSPCVAEAVNHAVEAVRRWAYVEEKKSQPGPLRTSH